jgi:putative ABC transport system permease protein
MTFFDLADGVDPAVVVARYPDGLPESAFGAPTEWLTSLAPAEVIETDRATGLIELMIALLALVVAASLLHALTRSVRDHRRDYGTLKAVGSTRRQILGFVTWQSLTPIVVALVLALPLGTVLGRSCWRLLAGMMGVIDTGVVPVLALGAVATLALVIAALIAVGPGLRAARAPTAALLRSE